MNKNKKPKQGLSDFFTRQRANEGIKLPLFTPDGQETEHYITIRGIDSDAFKQAQAAARRRVFELATEKANKEKVEQAQIEEELTLLSALVIDWSFPDPCTPENVNKLLREAPQIAEQINRISARRSLFFDNSLKPSTPSPTPTSS